MRTPVKSLVAAKKNCSEPFGAAEQPTMRTPVILLMAFASDFKKQMAEGICHLVQNF